MQIGKKVSYWTDRVAAYLPTKLDRLLMQITGSFLELQ